MLRAGLAAALAIALWWTAGRPAAAQTQPYIDSARVAQPPLPRPPAVGPSLRAALALQIALEARGYSPGLIDGVMGQKTRLALAAFQTAARLPPTGEPDPATLSLLAPRPEEALKPIRVAPADLALIDPPPRDWLERSRKRRLLYPSLLNLLAERAHTSERFLAGMNLHLDPGALRPGDVLWAPAVEEHGRLPVAVARVEIDLERKLVILFGSAGPAPPAGLLFCSIAADPARAPSGDSRVAVVAADPTYTFDPAKWPEVRGIDRKLTIPAGPRSPVGVRWIGLDLDGIGIHGAPEPELIGKTGSHGCFRLTNWDAVWLADLVQPGTPVRIVRSARESGWRWGS